MAEARCTIPALFARSVASRADEPALGTICAGELRWRSWREVDADARALAAALRAAGIGPGDRVAQVSENRYEWILADLAMHLAGVVHVPIHATLAGEQMAEQIAHCGARLVFASHEKLLAKFVQRLDAKTQVWIHDEHAPPHDSRPLAGTGALPVAAPGDLATILYTSGTTGRPRGVMLSQRNLASNATAVAEAHGGGHDQTRLSVLPLSHIYARTCDLYTWLYRGSRLVLAEGRETLLRDCRLASPTAFSAVPHVYHRIADQVRARKPADAAAALRAVFGGRIERLSCGGATLAPDYEAWYAEHGMPVLCGYGLTEAAPVVSTSTAAAWKPGCVGRPLPDVDLALASDGEILVRSPGVMLGYWNAPAETDAAIRDGWLHTGDLGALDAEGFLRIAGRKAEMIVLSTGKKVAPARVENLLTASPQIEQAAVFGEGRGSLVALIVPAESSAEDAFAAEIQRCLQTAAHEEQVRAWVLLDRPFSIERGELTAKLSLCRKTIATNFAAELATLESRGPDRPARANAPGIDSATDARA